MVKPEWGTKRICHNCGARFYDLHRDPIVCPKCATTFDPEALLRSRRSRSAIVSDIEKPAKGKAAAAAAAAPIAETEALEPAAETEEAAETESEELEEVESADESYEEEESDDSNVLLEDASELGDDNVDDVIDVEGSDEDSR
ncbi:MAG: TIGR02300 family protein [Alphaproteobacteria bacterium]|nr:TIGR02300 family protein [Alphaproteobacteria bacterium]